MGTRERVIPQLTSQDRILVEECKEKGLDKKFTEIQRAVWTKGPTDMDLQLLWFISRRENIKVPSHVVEHWKKRLTGWVSFNRAYGVVMILLDDHVHDFVAAKEFVATYEALRPKPPVKNVFPAKLDKAQTTADQLFIQGVARQRNSRLIT